MQRFLADASHELRTRWRRSGIRRADPAGATRCRRPPVCPGHRGRSRTDDVAGGRPAAAVAARRATGSRHRRHQMCDLVADAVPDAAVTAPDHHFVVDLPDEPLWARGDHGRSATLLAACWRMRASRTPAGVTVTTLRARVQDGKRQTVELTVSDDGPGIAPPSSRPVRPLRRAPTSRGHSQLGSTAWGWRSCDRSSRPGTVSVASVPGRTAFTVRLPAKRPDRLTFRRSPSSAAGQRLWGSRADRPVPQAH